MLPFISKNLVLTALIRSNSYKKITIPHQIKLVMKAWATMMAARTLKWKYWKSDASSPQESAGEEASTSVQEGGKVSRRLDGDQALPGLQVPGLPEVVKVVIAIITCTSTWWWWLWWKWWRKGQEKPRTKHEGMMFQLLKGKLIFFGSIFSKTYLYHNKGLLPL